jgi:serpin B
VTADPIVNPQPLAPTKNQAHAIARLGERLFTRTAAAADEPNPVVSPLSVYFALGLAAEGARGATADAFTQTLGLTSAEARGVALDLISSLTDPGPGTSLGIANSVWLDDSLTPVEAYVAAVQAYYHAEVYDQDLQASEAVGRINAWVKDATEGRIPEILDFLTDEAVAVLVNALTLTAAWSTEFNTDWTQTGNFTTGDGRTVEAHYMTARGTPQTIIQTPEAEGVLLPYLDGRLAFLAVKPTNGGIASLTLDGDAIAGWLAAAEPAESVNLWLPKFQTRARFELAEILAAMGLDIAFQNSVADFSGLGSSPRGPFHISRVIHEVMIAVGEKGTEAAAATVIGAETTSGPASDPIELHFDEPYVYAVVDTVTGIPLFLGSLDDPSAAPPAVT